MTVSRESRVADDRCCKSPYQRCPNGDRAPCRESGGAGAARGTVPRAARGARRCCPKRPALRRGSALGTPSSITTIVIPTRAPNCTSGSPRSAPASTPWTVAVARRAKLDKWIVCQTRRGSRRIIHELICTRSEKVERDDSPRDRARFPARRHRHEQLPPSELDVAVGGERAQVDRDEDEAQRAEVPVQVEQPCRDLAPAHDAARKCEPPHDARGDDAPRDQPAHRASHHQTCEFTAATIMRRPESRLALPPPSSSPSDRRARSSPRCRAGRAAHAHARIRRSVQPSRCPRARHASSSVTIDRGDAAIRRRAGCADR